WEPEKQWSRQLVQQVNMMQPKPRFLVICGDLLDAWPETEAEIRANQEIDFKSIFSSLEVPCVCVCGNHDIGNQPSMESVSRYRSSFGDDFFSFWCGGVYFLVLNSQYYEDSSRVPQLAADQEAWLEDQLKKITRMKPKHAVIFQHIPLFVNDPQEKKHYFNFSEDLRQVMLDKFYDAGVRHIFSGHYHRNAGGTFKDLEMVVTSAAGVQLGDDEPGYRIVNVTETSITHQYRNLNN
ncbi:Calcineurin-like phosphoesterase domain ApaH type, partial [Trinorchestia longiramus]